MWTFFLSCSILLTSAKASFSLIESFEIFLVNNFVCYLIGLALALALAFWFLKMDGHNSENLYSVYKSFFLCCSSLSCWMSLFLSLAALTFSAFKVAFLRFSTTKLFYLPVCLCSIFSIIKMTFWTSPSAYFSRVSLIYSNFGFFTLYFSCLFSSAL